MTDRGRTGGAPPAGRLRALVADDEPAIRFVLREALEGAGVEVVEAADGAAAERALDGGGLDLAFLDIRMPGPSGFDLLDRIATAGPGAPLAVVITAENTLENAVAAMQRGAFDYLTKPFDLEQIRALVVRVRRMLELRDEVRELRSRLGESLRGGTLLVGRSAPMVELFKTIGRVARGDAPVLILGETGSGKELVARAIHAFSRRREGPFVAVNVTAIPGELVEAELFGHERGAFTGATEARPGRFRLAHGGTLLLDEIGDLPPGLQAKLLRVLQEGEVVPVGGTRPIPVDVRVLAATHRDLEALVREGRFREDLYYRLHVVPVRVPPLRERIEDLPLLLEHFVERFARELGVPRRAFAAEALAALAAHPWPGNVRELENLVRRALLLGGGEVVTEPEVRGLLAGGLRAEAPDWAELARRELADRLERGPSGEEPGPYWSMVRRLERAIVAEAMRRARGNQLRAAALLGINRNTLRKKIVELGIDAESAP